MSTRDAIARALRRGLAVIGEPSLLDGTPCGNVKVLRDVDGFPAIMDRADDNHVVKVDTAAIDVRFTPRVGMVLEHPSDGRFRLKKLIKDDGVHRRFVVVKLPAP